MRHKIRLEGAVTPDAVREQYVYLPFEMPAGARRLDVNYYYDNQVNGAQETNAGNNIDIGVFDTRGADFLTGGFRGWSGGARTSFFVEPRAATPGYLRGPLQPGEWTIIFGCSKIEDPSVRYRVNIDVELDVLTAADDDAGDVARARRIHACARSPAAANGSAAAAGIAATCTPTASTATAPTPSTRLSTTRAASASSTSRSRTTTRSATGTTSRASTRATRRCSSPAKRSRCTAAMRTSGASTAGLTSAAATARRCAGSSKTPTAAVRCSRSTIPTRRSRGCTRPCAATRRSRSGTRPGAGSTSPRSCAGTDHLKAGERMVAVGGSDSHCVPPAKMTQPNGPGEPCSWVYVEGPLTERAVLDGVAARPRLHLRRPDRPVHRAARRRRRRRRLRSAPRRPHRRAGRPRA